MNAYEKINAMITDRMIARINETGTLPWKKPWTSVSMMPRNLVTKKNYRGANVFLLHSLGYASPYFLSFRQVAELGGKVKKGEHACPVVFWKFVEAEELETPDAKPYAFLRYYNVFNAEQCEGIDGKVPAVEIPKREHEPLEIAEALVTNMPHRPVISHGRTLACYSPLTDCVSMPCPEWFTSGEEYYGALFHELAHSTGHVSSFGSHDYSQEELVAEMCAAFLCGYTGILLCTETNSAAYLRGWLERLKADPALLVRAGGEAQKAFDFILGDAAEQELAEAA